MARFDIQALKPYSANYCPLDFSSLIPYNFPVSPSSRMPRSDEKLPTNHTLTVHDILPGMIPIRGSHRSNRDPAYAQIRKSTVQQKKRGGGVSFPFLSFFTTLPLGSTYTLPQ